MTLSYAKAIDYLYNLKWHGIKLGLENIRGLMAMLGEPHERFRSVHIAGTNGKGSTASTIAAVLQAAGYRTGLYTSPHLIDFTERIRVNGEPIAPERVARLTERVRTAAAEIPVTFFEFTTAMAFLHFAESSVDLAVAEVGMGGRFDATNVLTPLVSVITNIDFDHQAFLGNTIEQIAFEKAGIVKPGVPVVTATDHPEAMNVIRTACREQGAPLYRVGTEIRAEGSSPQKFRYQGIRRSYPDLNFSLLGKHQLMNAACALAALELLELQGLPVGEASIRRGLPTVQWEGRMEIIRPSLSGAAVLLDGAHNPAGARVLRAFLEEARPARPARLILVLGILGDKDIDGILAELVPLADEVVVTQPDYDRAEPATDLKRRLDSFSVHSSVREPVEEAVRYAQSVAAAADLICVTGSLYTIGEARSYLKGLAQPSALRG
jgi:dihydrofolate synthase/folylpolyglutamate synthase